MSANSSSGAMRRAVSGLIVLIGMVVSAGGALPAQASHSACRTDPIVILSDGHRLNLTAVVNIDSSGVQQVNYTLHIPSGVGLTRIIYTQGVPGLRESFAYSADQAARHYGTTTTIRTPGGTYTAGATLQIALAGAIVGTASVTGTSNTNLTLRVVATQ
jgi:hypothetical protein